MPGECWGYQCPRLIRMLQTIPICCFWVVLGFEYAPSTHSATPLIILGLTKPIIAFGKIHEMRAAMRVFVSAVADAAVVFGLLFTIVGGSAVVMLLLFHDQYDESSVVGTTADWFLDALVVMFVSCCTLSLL